MLFNDDYSFKGKHAEKVLLLTAPFDEKGNKFFIRNLDVYLLAPIIGFLYGKKSDLDNSGKTTNILFGAMSKEDTALWFNYRLIMLLDKDNEANADLRIEKAFREYGSEKAKKDEELYEAYVRGGIDILFDKLIPTDENMTPIPQSPEEYIKNLYIFIEEFEEKHGQNADKVLDLLQLAKS